MKQNKLAIHFLLVAAFVTLSGCAQPGTDTVVVRGQETVSDPAQPSPTPSQHMHDLMMRPMQSMRTTGNVDRDFAVMMAEHHEQAVLMAEVQVQHGTNEDLKSLARDIIREQSQERDRLLELAREEAETGTNTAASDRMHTIMMSGMHDIQMTGDVDRDFASMMIVHHQGAINMAEIQMEHGQNAELRRMASQAIADQKREIEFLTKHARA
jgi:uncharacterized protein (DUF305 family)